MAEWGCRIAINKGGDNIQHIDSEYVRGDRVGGRQANNKEATGPTTNGGKRYNGDCER